MRAGDTRWTAALPVTAVTLAAALVSGCISIDLKPKEVIGETVEVGKSVYRTIRRRINGTEERLYTHTVPLDEGATEHDVAIGCLAYLRGLADAAADDEATVLEESTERVRTGEDDALRCSLRAEV